MKKLLVLPVLLSLGSCSSSTQDLSLASVDFLCENYQWNLENPQNIMASAQTYADELRRRGQDCSDYEDKADVEIEVK